MSNIQGCRPDVPGTAPVIIGIYGISGSGKTYELNRLKRELDPAIFDFYEGSEVIRNVKSLDLSNANKLSDLVPMETLKQHYREDAIKAVREQCVKSGKVAIITGHVMLWNEESNEIEKVYTRCDLETFTHILYLDVPHEVIAGRRMQDSTRKRPHLSTEKLGQWQLAEKTELRRLCQNNGILFSILSKESISADRILVLLSYYKEKDNQARAEESLQKMVETDNGGFRTALIIDGDKTLAAEDTGELFWKTVSSTDGDYPLKSLFGSQLGYSYTAFVQAALLYEEVSESQNFDSICTEVASKVSIRSEFLSLMRQATEKEHIFVLVLTCGIRQVWEKVLEGVELGQKVKVIGSGRIRDGLVVTPSLKSDLVSRLQESHHMYVFAFGDSPLDLEMLQKADHAIIVVGDAKTRSKSMSKALSNAIENEGLEASQVLLPNTVPPILDALKLRIVQLSEHGFLDLILGQGPNLSVRHATGRNAAKLLMTPTRNAKVTGPALRAAHHQVGVYLATELVADVIGLEEYPIPHVSGYDISGYRLYQESQTLIVALMRGGEPMALGISAAFPLAAFLHAKNVDDIQPKHLDGRSTIILSDSVINNGKTMVDFVRRIHSLRNNIPIVAVTGVAQARSIETLSRSLRRHANYLNIVALRLSENKYTGIGVTDTGNRLFNTTHLEL